MTQLVLVLVPALLGLILIVRVGMALIKESAAGMYRGVSVNYKRPYSV